METMEKWSDERLDDLNNRVGSGFDRIDADLRGIRSEIGALRSEMRGEIGALESKMKGEIGALRSEMLGEIGDLRGEIGALESKMKGEIGALRSEMRGEIGDLRGEMNFRFEQVDARFDSLQRTMLQLGGGVIVALIGLIATQL
jgi:HAMP domain-containing protein